MVLLSFGDLWKGMSIITDIYWMITIPATIIFLIQLGRSFFVPKNVMVPIISSKNVKADGEVEIKFQIFTFRNIVGFCASMGWSGLACIDSGLTNAITILTSLVCGILLMGSMAIIFYFMEKLKTMEKDL